MFLFFFFFTPSTCKGFQNILNRWECPFESTAILLTTAVGERPGKRTISCHEINKPAGKRNDIRWDLPVSPDKNLYTTKLLTRRPTGRRERTQPKNVITYISWMRGMRMDDTSSILSPEQKKKNKITDSLIQLLTFSPTPDNLGGSD